MIVSSRFIAFLLGRKKVVNHTRFNFSLICELRIMNKIHTVAKTTDTRTRLLEAAHALIWQNSYSGVSVDDICRRANVNKGSFYHFFPSKNSLAIATLEDYWNALKLELDTLLGTPLNPDEKIKQMAQSAYEQQKQKFEQVGHVCGCPYAALGSEMSMQDESLRKAVDEKLQNLTRYFEKILQEGVETGLIETQHVAEKARKMNMFFMGVMTMARIQNTLDWFAHDLEWGLLTIAGFNRPAR